MSYILDALRKSEQERQRGTTPALDSIHVPVGSKPVRRNVLPWLFASVLLINAGALAWWFGPWHSRHEPAGEPALSRSANPASPDSGPSTNAGNAASEVPANQTLSKTPPSASGAGSEKTASQATEPAQASDSLNPTVTVNRKGPERPSAPAAKQPLTAPSTPQAKFGQAKPIEPSKSEVPAPSAASAAPPATQSASPPKGSEPSKGDDPKRLAARTPHLPQPAPPAVQAPPRPPTLPPQGGAADRGLIEDLKPLISETRPPRKEPEYHQIPASMKGGIPKLSLSFLVYSDKPEERRVTINGKVLREGDEVTDGLRLQRITHEGAVFDYRGFQFHKGVF